MRNNNQDILDELSQAEASAEFDSRDYERFISDEYNIQIPIWTARSYFRDDRPVWNSTDGTINIARAEPVDLSSFNTYWLPQTVYDDISFDSKALRGLNIAKKLVEFDLILTSKKALSQDELYLFGSDPSDYANIFYFKKVEQFTFDDELSDFPFQYKIHVAKFSAYEKNNGNFTVFAKNSPGSDIAQSIQLVNKNSRSLISKITINGITQIFPGFIPLKVQPTQLSNNRVQLLNWMQTNKVMPVSSLVDIIKNGSTINSLLTTITKGNNTVQFLVKFLFTLSQLRQDNFAGGDTGYLQYWAKLLKDKPIDETAKVMDEIFLKQIQLMDSGNSFKFVLENKSLQIVSMPAGDYTIWKANREEIIDNIKAFIVMASQSFYSNMVYDKGGALANAHQLDLPWYFRSFIRPTFIATIYAGLQTPNTATFDVEAHSQDVFGSDQVHIDSKYFKIALASAADQIRSFSRQLGFESDDLRLTQANLAGTVGHIWMVADSSYNTVSGYHIEDIKSISVNQVDYLTVENNVGGVNLKDLVNNAAANFKWTRGANELNADYVSDDGKTIHNHRGEVAFYRNGILNKLNALTINQIKTASNHFYVWVANAITRSGIDYYRTSTKRLDFDLTGLNIPSTATNIAINWSMSLQASQGRIESDWGLDVYVPYLRLNITWTEPGLHQTETTRIFDPVITKDNRDFINLDSQKVEIGWVGDRIEAIDLVDLPSAKKLEDINKYIVFIQNTENNLNALTFNQNVQQFSRPVFLNTWPELVWSKAYLGDLNEIDLTFIYATQFDLIINGTPIALDLFLGDATDDSITSGKLWFT